VLEETTLAVCRPSACFSFCCHLFLHRLNCLFRNYVNLLNLSLDVARIYVEMRYLQKTFWCAGYWSFVGVYRDENFFKAPSNGGTRINEFEDIVFCIHCSYVMAMLLRFSDTMSTCSLAFRASVLPWDDVSCLCVRSRGSNVGCFWLFFFLYLLQSVCQISIAAVIDDVSFSTNSVMVK